MIDSVPSHVPNHLAWDGDIATFPKQFADPFREASDAIHQGPDIVWAVRNAQFGRPGWLVTRHALLEEIYLDPQRFPARFNRGISDMVGEEVPLLPFESDPPMHRHYRQLLQPFFQPSAIKALDATVREVCISLIAGFADRKGCEFVAEFAGLLPSNLFIRMFGLPLEMIPQFLAWEHAYLGGDTIAEQIGAAAEIRAYLKDYCAQKRRNPGDDLISHIVTAQIWDRPLSEAEVDGMCFLLYGGGLDTVTNSLGWYFWHLARHPADQHRLRSAPGLIPQAVEELLRAYPVSNTNRTVAEDIDFHGVPMRKGDIVALPVFFAARDPHAYDDPHHVDFDRRPRHLTFGSGVHNCLGIHLAKREIRIALEEMLSRFASIRLADGAEPEFDFSVTWGVKRLDLVWD